MTDARGQSDLPTAFAMVESVQLLITGAVVALAIPYGPAAADAAPPRAAAASRSLG